MKIHYFQRYHAKENVATANTMLLLSRLYTYSADKFFRLLKSEFFSPSFEPEIVFTLQEKNEDSVPDATITQPSFKVVVETKLSDWFYSEQLEKHLKAFHDETYQVLITLAPEPMDESKKAAFEERLREYNAGRTVSVQHINTTFERLAEAVRESIDERDYEMQDVLEDYLNYCCSDGLIPVSDAWKWLRVQLAGVTFDFNFKENLYYDSMDRGFRAHDYLGLYRKKHVEAIGKISAIITAERQEDGSIVYREEKGLLTEERKEKIRRAIEDGKKYGYNLNSQRYFFVEQFYETDFQKSTPRAPMGSRVFDLTEVLNTDKLPDVPLLAQELRKRTWE